MSSKIMLITILIFVKIIVVANRVKADEIYLTCSNEVEIQIINNLNNPTYRCGNAPKFVRI